MTTNSFVIYRERNTIICINFSMMFDEMATRILSDIIYPSFIITLTPHLIFCPCQRFINANRRMPRTPISSKINNLCHILFFLPSPCCQGESDYLLSYNFPIFRKYIRYGRNPRICSSIWVNDKHLIGVVNVRILTIHQYVLGRLRK